MPQTPQPTPQEQDKAKAEQINNNINLTIMTLSLGIGTLGLSYFNFLDNARNPSITKHVAANSLLLTSLALAATAAGFTASNIMLLYKRLCPTPTPDVENAEQVDGETNTPQTSPTYRR